MPPAKKNVPPEKRCVGRACGEKIQEPGMKFARYTDVQCDNECADPDSKLCITCKKKKTLFDAGINTKTTWHGIYGEPNIPAKSHIVGSNWSRTQNAENFARATSNVTAKKRTTKKNTNAAAGGNTTRRNAVPATNKMAAVRAAKTAYAALNEGTKAERAGIKKAYTDIASVYENVRTQVKVVEGAASDAKSAAQTAVAELAKAKAAAIQIKEALSTLKAQNAFIRTQATEKKAPAAYNPFDDDTGPSVFVPPATNIKNSSPKPAANTNMFNLFSSTPPATTNTSIFTPPPIFTPPVTTNTSIFTPPPIFTPPANAKAKSKPSTPVATANNLYANIGNFDSPGLA